MDELWPGGLPFGGKPVLDFVVVCVSGNFLVSSYQLGRYSGSDLTPFSDLEFGNLIVTMGYEQKSVMQRRKLIPSSRHCATDNV